MDKLTVVWGASLKAERFSNKAVRMLHASGYPVVAVGLKRGQIGDVPVQTFEEKLPGNVHTVTLYVSPKRQPEYFQKILSQNPKRVIFNPGTENPEFEEILRKNGIEVVKNCTLVMLRNHLF